MPHFGKPMIGRLDLVGGGAYPDFKNVEGVHRGSKCSRGHACFEG